MNTAVTDPASMSLPPASAIAHGTTGSSSEKPPKAAADVDHAGIRPRTVNSPCCSATSSNRKTPAAAASTVRASSTPANNVLRAFHIDHVPPAANPATMKHR